MSLNKSLKKHDCVFASKEAAERRGVRGEEEKGENKEGENGEKKEKRGERK